MVVQLTAALPYSGSRLAASLPRSLVDHLYDAAPMDAGTLQLATWDQIHEALASAPPKAERILIDGAVFKRWMPQFIVALSVLLVDWNGREVCVGLPGNEDASHLLRPLADLLRGLEQRAKGVRIISCPTCARRHTDLLPLVKRLGRQLERITQPLDVAVMGCEVNGPGEAKAADVGVAFGKGVGLVFRHGRIIKRVAEEETETALLEEIRSLSFRKTGD